MGGDSTCNDNDRKYLKDKDLGKSFGLKCNELDDAITPCIRRRIKKDMDTNCFGKWSWCKNNCQNYAQDIISDCKGQK